MLSVYLGDEGEPSVTWSQVGLESEREFKISAFWSILVKIRIIRGGIGVNVVMACQTRFDAMFGEIEIVKVVIFQIDKWGEQPVRRELHCVYLFIERE